MKFVNNKNIKLRNLPKFRLQVINRSGENGRIFVNKTLEANIQYNLRILADVYTKKKGVIIPFIEIDGKVNQLNNKKLVSKIVMNYTFSHPKDCQCKIGLIMKNCQINDFVTLREFTVTNEKSRDNGKRLNDYFENIFLINLDRRPDKLERMDRILKEKNIKYERISAIDGNNQEIQEIFKSIKDPEYGSQLNSSLELGCVMSHIKAIQLAKERGYKNVLIIEDDIIFHKNFDTLLWKIDTVPPDWDILYLGCSQRRCRFNLINLDYSTYHPAIDTDGTFAYSISQKAYDLTLASLNRKISPADLSLREVQKRGHSFAIYDYLIIADVGDSDIRESRNIRNHCNIICWNLDNFIN